MRRFLLLFIVVLFFATSVSAAEMLLADLGSATTGNNVQAVGAYRWSCATFNTTVSARVSNITTYIYSVSGLNVATHVGVWMNNATLGPNSTQIGSNSSDYSSFSTGYMNWSFTGGDVTLSPGNRYWACWFVDSANFIRFGETNGVGSSIWFASTGTNLMTLQTDFGASNVQTLNIKIWGVPSQNIVTTLVSPINDSTITSSQANFTTSYLTAGYNLTNATYFIWNLNGSLFNRTTVPVTGNTSNTTILEISDFVDGDSYLWNVRACGVNTTSTLCNFATNNFTFRAVPFTPTSVYYANSTFETAYERFNLTITADDFIAATANLIYNGTSYLSSSTCTLVSCTFTNNLDIPLVRLPIENRSFYWNISIYQGSLVTYYSSSTYVQEVLELNLSSTNIGSQSINFSVYDEQNQSKISPYSFDGSFEYYAGNGTVRKNVSVTQPSTDSVALYVNRNISYYINSIIAYSAPNSSTPYITRNWFYQHYQINNTLKIVPMYLLRTASSTSFVLSVQDQSRLALKGVLVEVQRCYPGNPANQTPLTVFKARTDSNGLTTGNFEAETALYQFLITNNSQTLLTVGPCSKVVPQTVPYTLNFILGQSYISPFNDIDSISDVSSELYYNYTSNILTWTYIDTSGNFTNAQLVVRNLNYSGRGTNVVCTGNNSLSSGVITCNVSQPGSYYAQVYLYRGSQILIDQITFVVNTLATSLGYYSVFLCFFLLLICGFAFKYNEIAGIALLNVGVIAINYMGWVAFGNVFITAMVCVSLLIAAVLQR